MSMKNLIHLHLVRFLKKISDVKISILGRSTATLYTQSLREKEKLDKMQEKIVNKRRKAMEEFGRASCEYNRALEEYRLNFGETPLKNPVQIKIFWDEL